MELMMNNQDEIDFLLQHVKDKDVLEWGSGGSTIAIAKIAKSLVSIEHDGDWYYKVLQSFPDAIRPTSKSAFVDRPKLNYHLVPRNKEEAPGDDGTLADYFSYVCFPAKLKKTFDVIFIDGRARVECAKVAVELLKPGGIILIHDYRHPQEQYRRYEYEVIESILGWVDGVYALHALKPKTAWISGTDTIGNLSFPKQKVSMSEISEQSKKMCWYDMECVESMNRFYAECIKGKEKEVAETNPTKYFIKLLNQVDAGCGKKLLDFGTGTAMIADFSPGYQFTGCDLPHILAGCAMYWHPQYWYRACDVITDDIAWINEFDVVVCNGFIDVMENALQVFEKILHHTNNYLLLHRQEITEQNQTSQIINKSYNSDTWHSIISRKDFKALLDKMNFDIVAEEKLEFGNWENGGSSFLLKRRKSWALNGIDHYLNQKYFAGKGSGTFFEAGANDGLRQSNTKYFEHYKNWMGILVEPALEQYHQLRGNRIGNNVIVHGALVAPDYPHENIGIVYTPDNYGLMSVIDDSNAEELLKRIRDERRETIQVPAMTINSILEKSWSPDIPIDLMVLDMEGYEVKALRGLNLDNWQIEFILVEQLTENAEIAEMLAARYDLVEVIGDHDYLYKRKL